MTKKHLVQVRQCLQPIDSWFVSNLSLGAERLHDTAFTVSQMRKRTEVLKRRVSLSPGH